MVLSLSLSGAWGAPATAPHADVIIREAVERSQWADRRDAKRKLTYTKTGIVEELDSSGRVSDRKEKLYDIVYHSGRIQMRLLSVNGRQPSQKHHSQEEQDARDNSKAEAKSPRGEERPIYLTHDLVSKYLFTLFEQKLINGRNTYGLSFQPKRGLPVNDLEDRFLNQMAGKVWIDAREYEIVQAQIHLRAPVTLWGGVLGALKKFNYTVERGPVADGVWFNRASQSEMEYRKLFDSTHLRTRSKWSPVRVS